MDGQGRGLMDGWIEREMNGCPGIIKRDGGRPREKRMFI